LEVPDPNDASSNVRELVMNVQRLIADFQVMEDQELRSEQIRRHLQGQNDQQLLNINQEQIDALIYLREYHKLYNPHTLWKFNKKLIDDIRKKKRIVCQRIFSMSKSSHESIRESNSQSSLIKVQIEAIFTDHGVDSGDDQDDYLFYSGLMANSITVKLSATAAAGGQGEAPNVRFQAQEFSMLDLQTIMYMFEGLSLIDPGFVPRRASSLPFYLIDSFQDLCQFVLFHYVQTSKVALDDEDEGQDVGGRKAGSDLGLNLAGRGGAAPEELTIEFSEHPEGIFAEPLPMKFLISPGAQ